MGGWNNPFQYAGWLIEDTQTIIHRDLQFYNDSGLSPDFIVNNLESPRDELWYPSKNQLVSGGVLANK